MRTSAVRIHVHRKRLFKAHPCAECGAGLEAGTLALFVAHHGPFHDGCAAAWCRRQAKSAANRWALVLRRLREWLGPQLPALGEMALPLGERPRPPGRQPGSAVAGNGQRATGNRMMGAPVPDGDPRNLLPVACSLLPFPGGAA
jgi:hypothetical protein